MKKSKIKNIILLTAFAALVFIILSVTCFADAKDEPQVIKPTGQTFYVSVNGSDTNPGSENKPWRTIQKAANSVNPGDQVYIREGTYKERVKMTRSGTEGNYITYENYPKEHPIVDGTGISWGYDWGCLVDLNEQKYIKVSGLKVINSVWAGIGSAEDSGGCQNVIVQNCSTYNTKSSGIAFFSGNNITIDNNTVELACVRTDGSQENISICNVSNFEVKNNHVFNCTNDKIGGEGINIKDGCYNGKIYNNIVHDIKKVGIYIDAYSMNQYNLEIYGNIIYNAPDGIALASERGGHLENISIHDNEVFDCANWGYIISSWGDEDVAHPMKNITFINNTTKNLGDGGVYLNNPHAENVVIKDNIFKTGGAYTPIYLNGGNLLKTSIYGNTLNRIVAGQPTGTDYNLYNAVN